MIWEAQYGDFINGAQVILDQFVTSGRAKWGLQAVARASCCRTATKARARSTRARAPSAFLQAAADINLRLVNCTTAAQYFHLLRRQARAARRAIRCRSSSSRRRACCGIPPSRRRRASSRKGASSRSSTMRRRGRGRRAIKRLVLCSGKVYVDLISSERRAAAKDVAICRVEQLYPFPETALARSARRLSVAPRRRLAAGRAREHGRVGVRAAAARGADRRPLPAALHRPRAQLEPVGRARRRGTSSIRRRSSSRRSILDEPRVGGRRWCCRSRSAA